jgi:hypothetical protein
VNLSISSPTVTEGHSGTVNAVFNITLSSASSRDVTVNYSTADLNANEEYWYGGTTATAGVDYTAQVGTLTIPAGQTSGTISVPVHGDRIGEWNELFFLHLGNPTHATLTSNLALGTITDDEPYVSFEYYSSSEVVEGNSGTKSMTFTVGSALRRSRDGGSPRMTASVVGSDYRSRRNLDFRRRHQPDHCRR